MTPFIAVPAWAIIGGAAGWGVRRLSVRLAVAEELEPGRRGWQVFGPPVLAAVLFAVFAYAYAGRPLVLAVDSVFVAVMVQVVFFDLEHQMILDRVVLPAMVLALALSLFKQPWWAGLATGAAVGAAFFLLGAVGTLIFKADALGFGDVKLGGLVGLLLGPLTAAESLVVAFAAAGAVAIAIAVGQRSLKGTVALGPFLAAGAIFGLLHPY